MADSKVVLRTIDGMTFQIGLLTGRPAVKMLYKLAKGVFPTAGKLIGEVVDDKSKELLDLDVGRILAAISAALPQFFQNVSLEEFEEIRDGLLEVVFLKGKAEMVPVLEVYDGIFAGKTLASLKLLFAAIEVNYRDFWQGRDLADVGSKLRALRSRVSPEKSKSAGPSGDSSTPGGEN